MPELNYLAVAVAAAAAFGSGFGYYVALSGPYARLSPAAAGAAGPPPPWTLPVEVLRCLVLTVVVAGLAAKTGVDGWPGVLALWLALWVGFPLVLWLGAVAHERTPVALAALHAGDWLIKLFVITAIVGLWR
jgi:hypothetical protein